MDDLLAEKLIVCQPQSFGCSIGWFKHSSNCLHDDWKLKRVDEILIYSSNAIAFLWIDEYLSSRSRDVQADLTECNQSLRNRLLLDV